MTRHSTHPKRFERIVIVAGGWSEEREVSLASGKSMYDALMQSGRYASVSIIDAGQDLPTLVQDILNARPDVILNALHGVGGEDGVIQGVFEMLRIPYTHSGVTASALAMDKVLSRIIFEKAGIPVPTWKLCELNELRKLCNLSDLSDRSDLSYRSDLSNLNDLCNLCDLSDLANNARAPLAFPFVIKPRKEGSSVGVHIIKSANALAEALATWNYGTQILIEEYLQGKEIQTAVLNGTPLGTIEIRPCGEFFDYRSKYTPGGAAHIMPADIPARAYEQVHEFAKTAYQMLGCRGIARLDFIYVPPSTCGQDAANSDGANGDAANRGGASEDAPAGTSYLLELNSQPGMTETSLVPDIAKYMGWSYLDVIERMLCDVELNLVD
ncbi:MAG: D-alanine--D-alanine ligase [Holosporales bacterium]|jgi:D-alanine-D-alanine ligase|nr:D-alanine--D-alanine ligase [Holosporales bacterium]